MDDELIEMTTQVDREILVALLIGSADKPSNLAKICSRHVQSIYDRLTRLVDQELVYNKGSGVYQLTESGTETARAIQLEYDIAEDLEFRRP